MTKDDIKYAIDRLLILLVVMIFCGAVMSCSDAIGSAMEKAAFDIAGALEKK